MSRIPGTGQGQEEGREEREGEESLPDHRPNFMVAILKDSSKLTKHLGCSPETFQELTIWP